MTFFASLAEDQGRYAICMVRSDTGSDGTLGLRVIKEHGGMAMTQDEDSARYRKMPHNAYATGLGDYMLAAEDMPAQLIECAEHLGQISDEEIADGLRKNGRKTLSHILALLRSRTGHDFSQYKESTVIRRVEWRIQMTKASSPEDYLQRLRNSPTEMSQLFNDMLVGITQFMRDPELFERLANDIVPQICGTKVRDNNMRIWVPGCSTGEEAYSIAILFFEDLQRVQCTVHLQVFATNIDKALEPDRMAWTVGAVVR
ncbi:MAG: hypothetical protein M3120_11555 [Pseudomonadota bacterium]|nr:hypothetical protein [Pseudomonadota bacterium]